MGDGQLAVGEGPQGPQGSLGVEVVSKVVGSQSMERFLGEEENFVCDTGFDAEPEKLLEDRGNVLPVPSACYTEFWTHCSLSRTLLGKVR